MPRKYRPGKGRRAVGWELETLHPLYDLLTLQSGCFRSESNNPKVRIRSIADAREAWEANREAFMLMCTCYRDKPSCAQHDTAYLPGSRPWAYWKFDLGRDVPANQEAELRRLGLIAPEEEKALQARRLLREEGSRADVRAFPGPAGENEE